MGIRETFRSHIETVAPRISVDLISPQGMEALKRFCGLLPFDTATSFGFESRLGDQAPVCDFFLMMTAEGHGPAMLAGKSQVARLSPAIFMDPFWKRLTDLFLAWAGGSPLLAGKLELIWLEFDNTGVNFISTPNIFFRIRQTTGSDRTGQWSDMLQVLQEIYLILFGIGFPDHLARSLTKCVDALPDGAGLYQTGFMVPRKTEAIRLVITNISKNDLPGYLTKIGLPGELQVIETLLDRYAPLFDYTVFNIHIGETVLPFAGMEMYLREMRQPQWEPRWKEIFHALVSENLALEKKCNALIRFCGKNTKMNLYPVQYINGINHLKLVYKQGLPPECKAYFGTMIRK